MSIDPDGLMKRDKNGNLIFTPMPRGRFSNGKNPREIGHPHGEKAQMTVGFLKTDDGTNVVAVRYESGDKEMKTNCHGLAYADGQFGIDNGQAQSILDHDGYKEVKDGANAQVGDMAVYFDSDGKPVHSVTVTAVDENGRPVNESGLGGVDMAAQTEKAGQSYPADPKAKARYFHKETDSRTDAQKKEQIDRTKTYRKDDEVK